jgi:hypothetical protein
VITKYQVTGDWSCLELTSNNAEVLHGSTLTSFVESMQQTEDKTF